ncbi:hypothetical protein GCM10009618_00870 [Nesterenkonia lacusekhoensis]
MVHPTDHRAAEDEDVGVVHGADLHCAPAQRLAEQTAVRRRRLENPKLLQRGCDMSFYEPSQGLLILRHGTRIVESGAYPIQSG